MKTRYDEKTLLQAKADYDAGATLEVVATAYGCSYTNLHYIFKKRGWPLRKIGNKVNHRLKNFDAADVLPNLAAWQKIPANEKGAIAESMVAVWLASHGLDVWRPMYAHHCCDLAVLHVATLVRCQVKVATYNTKSKLFEVHLHRNGRGGKPRYDATRVDFFIVLCQGLSTPTFYVLPMSERFPSSRARFYPHRRHFLGNRDWEQYKDAIHLLKAA